MERRLVWATLLAVIAALGLSALLLKQSLDPTLLPAVTLGEVFERNLIATRIILGAILIAGWPLALRGVASMLQIRFQRPSRFLGLSGMLLAGTSYALTFLPGPWAGTALLVPTLLSLILFRSLLRMGWGHVLRLWLAQLLAVSVLMSAALWGLESAASRRMLNPVEELPIILEFARRPPNDPREISFHVFANEAAVAQFSWSSSKSIWLDWRANQAQVVVNNYARSALWDISLRIRHDGPVFSSVKQGSSPWISTRFTPQIATTYTISMDSPVQPGDLVYVYSLLPMNPTDPVPDRVDSSPQ